MAYNLAQKVSGNAKTVITDMANVLSSIDTLSLCNIHATDTVTVDLYVASQVTTDVTDTGANVNNGSNYAAGATSVAADGSFGGTDAIRSDLFLDERVYKEDGTFIGICTAIHSTGTPLTFSAGLEVALLDDENLHTGTRYYILKSYVLPKNATLVLEKNELRVDPQIYTMYIKLSAADSAVDLITRK